MLSSLFGSSCLGFVYQTFLQQASHARTQHAKASCMSSTPNQGSTRLPAATALACATPRGRSCCQVVGHTAVEITLAQCQILHITSCSPCKLQVVLRSYSLAAGACADMVALHARTLAGREDGVCAQHAPFFSAAMAMCATTPSRKRKQGLATSPQSEEKKLPAAEAKARPLATAAGSNQKPHRAQPSQHIQNDGGPWGRHRYTHMNQDPAATRPC